MKNIRVADWWESDHKLLFPCWSATYTLTIHVKTPLQSSMHPLFVGYNYELKVMANLYKTYLYGWFYLYVSQASNSWSNHHFGSWFYSKYYAFNLSVVIYSMSKEWIQLKQALHGWSLAIVYDSPWSPSLSCVTAHDSSRQTQHHFILSSTTNTTIWISTNSQRNESRYGKS